MLHSVSVPSVEELYNEEGELRYIKPLGSPCMVPLRITQDEWNIITSYPELQEEDRATPKVIVHPLFTIALERMLINVKTQIRPESRLCVSIVCPGAKFHKTAFYGSYQDVEEVAREKALKYLCRSGVVEIIASKKKTKEPISA